MKNFGRHLFTGMLVAGALSSAFAAGAKAPTKAAVAKTTAVKNRNLRNAKAKTAANLRSARAKNVAKAHSARLRQSHKAAVTHANMVKKTSAKKP